MRIDVIGDDSISRQARTYAEYRLFAALSGVVDSSRVRSASLSLHRTRVGEDCDAVLCAVTVELTNGKVTRRSASGDYPYAAINRAIGRLRRNDWPVAQDPLPWEMHPTE